MTVKCVDISHYQAGFNFAEFKKGGGLAVIAKASENRSKDSSYDTFRSQARANGLAFASYHFLRPGDMSKQAQFFYSVVQPQPGERMIADYEVAGIMLTDLNQFLQTLLHIDESLQLTVYSGHTIKEQLGNWCNTWLWENTSLWLAEYSTLSSPKSWPKETWANWSLWQYSDKGRVPGFNGDVDCNVFNGSDSAMLRWFGPVPQEQPVPISPVAEIPEVHITIKGKAAVFINGIGYGVFKDS